MPERKVPLGVGEAEALADWLEWVAKDYQSELSKWRDHRADSLPAMRLLERRNEARAWAEAVRPVEIGGVVMKEGR